MKISYVSDLHLDFWVRTDKNIKKYLRNTEELILKLISTDTSKREVLIIAGDLGHVNTQSLAALRVFSEYYGKVYYTIGNHDMYLTSNRQSKKYLNDSMNRIKELISFTESNFNNVHALFDDTIHEFKGIRIAGLTMWYPIETIQQRIFFENASNDSVYIKGVDIHEMHIKDQTNYRLLLKEEIDIMVSHVPVINIDTHFEHNSTSGYLCPLPDLNVGHWIFGHSHEQKVYEKPYGNFYMNALGYPNEKLTQTIKSFEYEKEERE